MRRVEWVQNNGSVEMFAMVISSSTSFTIASLAAFTEYNVVVFASTSAGQGSANTVTGIRTLAGGELKLIMRCIIVQNKRNLISVHYLIAARTKPISVIQSFIDLQYPIL